jgi:hypothetical protein
MGSTGSAGDIQQVVSAAVISAVRRRRVVWQISHDQMECGASTFRSEGMYVPPKCCQNCIRQHAFLSEKMINLIWNWMCLDASDNVLPAISFPFMPRTGRVTRCSDRYVAHCTCSGWQSREMAHVVEWERAREVECPEKSYHISTLSTINSTLTDRRLNMGQSDAKPETNRPELRRSWTRNILKSLHIRRNSCMFIEIPNYFLVLRKQNVLGYKLQKYVL